MSEDIATGIKRSPEAQPDDELPSPKRPEYDEVQEVTVDAEISLPTTEVATEQDSTTGMLNRSDSPTNSYSNVSGTMYSPQNMVNFQTSPAAISNALEMLMQMQQAFNQKMGQQSASQQAHSPGQAAAQEPTESGGQSSAPVYLMVPSGTPPEYLQGSRTLAPRREGESSSGKVVSDREMQRKASHNEVERRRRERINELTRSLAKLIPACQKETSTSGKVGSASLNKGFVLEKAIEYIKELHTLNGQLGDLVKNKEQAHNALQVLQGQITILEKENEFLRFQLKQLSMQPPTSQHGSLSQLILQGLSKGGLKGEEGGAAATLSNTSSPTPSSIHLTPTGTPSTGANGVQSSPAAYQPSPAASTSSTNLYLTRDLLPQLVEAARNSQATPEKPQSNPEPTVEEPAPPTQTAATPAQ